MLLRFQGAPILTLTRLFRLCFGFCRRRLRSGWFVRNRQVAQAGIAPDSSKRVPRAGCGCIAEGEKRWRFPSAIMELENSPGEDQIAYSLWKVISVRADLRNRLLLPDEP